MMQNFERPCWGGQCTQKGQDSPGFCKCKADAAEIERLRALVQIAYDAYDKGDEDAGVVACAEIYSQVTAYQQSPRTET